MLRILSTTLICALLSAQFTHGETTREIRKQVREWAEAIHQTNLSIEKLPEEFDTQETQTLVFVCETSGSVKTPVGDGRLLATSYTIQSLLEKYSSIDQLIVFDGDGNMTARYKNAEPFNDEQRTFLKERMEEFKDYAYESGRSSLIGVQKSIDYLISQGLESKCSIILLGDSIYNKTVDEKNARTHIIEKIKDRSNIRVSAIYLEFIPLDPPKRKKGSLRHEYSLEHEFHMHYRNFIEEAMEITAASGGGVLRVALEKEKNPSEKYSDLTSDDRFPTFNVIKK